MDIKDYINKNKALVDTALKDYLKPGEGKISETMRYAVSGGKRLRPLLLITVFESLGGKLDRKVLKIACAVEFIHVFSLVQDDLPAMDNDDYRRGRLSTHKVFGEDIALLASDALLNAAYGIILIDKSSDFSPCLKIKVLSELTTAVGLKGLIGGQVEDLELTKKMVSVRRINDIYLKKTGMLIAACVNIAAILRGVGSAKLKICDGFGKKLGLSYQILDDILNEAGDEKMLKGRKDSDKRRGKLAYPSLVGIERSRDILADLIRQVKLDIRKLDTDDGRLSVLCDHIFARSY